MLQRAGRFKQWSGAGRKPRSRAEANRGTLFQLQTGSFSEQRRGRRGKNTSGMIRASPVSSAHAAPAGGRLWQKAKQTREQEHREQENRKQENRKKTRMPESGGRQCS